MHANYEFLLEQTQSMCPVGGKCLDYGCGKGQIVEEGLRRSIDFYGVEAFSAGSGTQIETALREKGLLGDRVRALNLENFQIPFPDDYFDVVVSNEVFEHVVDLNGTLTELHRVMKSGGKLVAIFPTFEVIREVHCGVLFAHWLPKSRIRYCWLLLWRSLGVGRLKKGRSIHKWASFFNDWLVENVSYRWPSELHQRFRTTFADIVHLEDEYMRYRIMRRRHAIPSILDNRLARIFTRRIYRRWGGFVVSLRKT